MCVCVCVCVRVAHDIVLIVWFVDLSFFRFFFSEMSRFVVRGGCICAKRDPRRPSSRATPGRTC